MVSLVDPLLGGLKASFAGLHTQSMRMSVISQNIANAHTTGKTAGADPYQRQTVSFKQELDRTTGINLVMLHKISRDQSAFKVEYDPGHPAADEDGMVKLSNVRPLVELTDMREAGRGYEANLKIASQIRSMVMQTIGMIRPS